MTKAEFHLSNCLRSLLALGLLAGIVIGGLNEETDIAGFCFIAYNVYSIYYVCHLIKTVFPAMGVGLGFMAILAPFTGGCGPLMLVTWAVSVSFTPLLSTIFFIWHLILFIATSGSRETISYKRPTEERPESNSTHTNIPAHTNIPTHTYTPTEEKEEFEIKHEYYLTLSGNRGKKTISDKDTPFVVTPYVYDQLSNDTLKLYDNVYEIDSYVNTYINECTWYIRNVSGTIKLQVIHNGSELASKTTLANGDHIHLKQTVTEPEIKTEDKRRKVLSLVLIGSDGKVSISPLSSLHHIDQLVYAKLFKNGKEVEKCPFTLSPDKKRSGAMWFITPENDSEWDVLVNGKQISGRDRITPASTISLRRKGEGETAEELFCITVQGAFRTAVTPGKVIQPEKTTTEEMGHITVIIEHKTEYVEKRS